MTAADKPTVSDEAVEQARKREASQLRKLRDAEATIERVRALADEYDKADTAVYLAPWVVRDRLRAALTQPATQEADQ